MEKLCVIVPVIGGAMFATFRFLYKRWLAMVLSAIQFQLNQQFQTLMAEVRPNGGKSRSLGDTIVRLVRTTEEQTEILKEHTTQLQAITGTTDDSNRLLASQIKQEARDELPGSDRAIEVDHQIESTRVRLDGRAGRSVD